jgi:hypothetical protein
MVSGLGQCIAETIDSTEHYIDRVDVILGILMECIRSTL